MGCQFKSHLKAVSKESDDQSNDTPTSTPSPQAEMAVGRFILVLRHRKKIHTGNFHRIGYLMLHHLAGATIHVANIVNNNCHPIEDGNNRCNFTPNLVAAELPLIPV